MDADADDDQVAESGDTFVEEYEFATDADVIDVDDDTDADEEGAVAGSFAPAIEVQPESPSPENVLFVALGVYVATLALGQMFAGSTIYAPGTLAAITAAVAVGTAICYGILVKTDPDT